MALGLRDLPIFNQPTTLHFNNEFQKDSIITQVIKEIYEIQLQSVPTSSNEISSDEFSVNIMINQNLGLIQIEGTPVSQVIIPADSTTTNGDDADCGGKSGDGWKSYGTCQSKKCTEEKINEAANELSQGLSSGKCLDVKIKRNTLSTRVCVRVIKC